MEATLVVGDQKIVFQTPALVAEREVVVYVGDCQTRRLAAIVEQMDREPLPPQAEYLRLSEEKIKEQSKAVCLKISAQSLVLENTSVVPMHNAGLTALGSFRTNSRFVSLRVEFPDDGDYYEAIVDLGRGGFVVFNREGSYVHLRQSVSKPTFM